MHEIVRLGRTNPKLRSAISRHFVDQACRIERSVLASRRREWCEDHGGHSFDSGFSDGRDMGARCLRCGANEE
jgi:hypothetical protein